MERRHYTPVPPPIEEDPLAATEISSRAKTNKSRNTGEFEHMFASEASPPPVPASEAKRREKQAVVPPPLQDDPFAVVEDDPFVVKEDVLNVFEEEPAQQEEEQEASDDAVFVFGNPFEGPLPDVFMEDEDLKRSVMEQQAGLSEDTSPQRAVKKPGQKPTGIRKRSSSS
jgi:hypothetical protein